MFLCLDVIGSAQRRGFSLSSIVTVLNLNLLLFPPSNELRQ